MRLNAEQQRQVEENMGLVGKVIKDKVHGLGKPGMISFDDLFQTGCIGLCKAAATDKGGGCFSTYAYRLIWNEISDALIRFTKLNNRKQEIPEEFVVMENPVWEQADARELRQLLSAAGKQAGGVIPLGIKALELSSQGYDSREVGQILGAQPGTVRMWMTRTRRFLKEQPALREAAGI